MTGNISGMSILERNMNKFINATEMSISQKNWYSALTLAVTIPDICCRLDGTKNGKGSKIPYINWFNEYIGNMYKVDTGKKDEFVYIDGNNAYALRCAFLHDGDGYIKQQSARNEELKIDEIAFITPEFLEDGTKYCLSAAIMEGKLILNVENYCQHIIEGVKKWVDENSGNTKTEENANKMIKIGESKEILWR